MTGHHFVPRNNYDRCHLLPKDTQDLHNYYLEYETFEERRGEETNGCNDIVRHIALLS